MEEEFVPYEQALRLKELGFDKPCIRGWDINNKVWYHPDSDIVIDNPTFSQAFRWFREKHNIDAWVQPFVMKKSNGDLYLPDESYSYFIFKDGVFVRDGVDSLEPEEAELACLERLIDLLEASS